MKEVITAIEQDKSLFSSAIVSAKIKKRYLLKSMI